MIDLTKQRNEDEATIANHIYDSKYYNSKKKYKLSSVANWFSESIY